MDEVRATLPVHPARPRAVPARRSGRPRRGRRPRSTPRAATPASCSSPGTACRRACATPCSTAFGAFFDLPLAEKRRFVVADEAANRGYSELGKEGLAYSRGEETPPDLFEAFNVGREDTIGPYYDH